jgi:uncharacterized protein (DUF1015 family)
MAFVNPFKGYYFDPNKVKLDDIIIPPYDIISEKERDEYKCRSPYNMAHGTLADGEGLQKYKNAKAYLDKVLNDGILIKDKQESLYVVEQVDTENETKRIFFLASVDLKEYKKRILPHEKTFEEPKQDRKLLLKAIKANIECPFFLYSDVHRMVTGRFEYIMKSTPMLKFTDVNDVSYSIWRFTDKSDIKTIQDIMENKKLYIADGHHRTESSYDVYKESGFKEEYRYMMAAIANYNDEEKAVLPTHRLLYGLQKFNIAELERKLTKNYFDLHIFQYDSADEETQLDKMKKMMRESERNNVIGMYHPASKRYYAISPKDPRKVSQWVEKERKELKDSSGIKKQLDVTWLHSLILDPMLGIDSTTRKQKNISYVKGSHEDAIKAMAKDKKFQLVFFLNPTDLNDIIAVADECDTVPQKTTYFFPKIDSGLIIQKLL